MSTQYPIYYLAPPLIQSNDLKYSVDKTYKRRRTIKINNKREEKLLKDWVPANLLMESKITSDRTIEDIIKLPKKPNFYNYLSIHDRTVNINNSSFYIVKSQMTHLKRDIIKKFASRYIITRTIESYIKDHLKLSSKHITIPQKYIKDKPSDLAVKNKKQLKELIDSLRATFKNDKTDYIKLTLKYLDKSEKEIVITPSDYKDKIENMWKIYNKPQKVDVYDGINDIVDVNGDYFVDYSYVVYNKTKVKGKKSKKPRVKGGWIDLVIDDPKKEKFKFTDDEYDYIEKILDISTHRNIKTKIVHKSCFAWCLLQYSKLLSEDEITWIYQHSNNILRYIKFEDVPKKVLPNLPSIKSIKIYKRCLSKKDNSTLTNTYINKDWNENGDEVNVEINLLEDHYFPHIPQLPFAFSQSQTTNIKKYSSMNFVEYLIQLREDDDIPQVRRYTNTELVKSIGVLKNDKYTIKPGCFIEGLDYTKQYRYKATDKPNKNKIDGTVVFDTEAYKDIKTKIIKYYLGVCKGYSNNLKGLHIESIGENDMKYFCKRLIESVLKTDENIKKIRCYAFNLQYDLMSLLKDVTYITSKDIERSSKKLCISAIFYIDKEKKLEIEFVDACSIMGLGSLENSCDALNVSGGKTKFPYRCMDICEGCRNDIDKHSHPFEYYNEYGWKKKDWKEFWDGDTNLNLLRKCLEYCRNDVDVTMKCMDKFKDFMNVMSNEICEGDYDVWNENSYSANSIMTKLMERAGCYDGVYRQSQLLSEGFVKNFLNGGRVSGNFDNEGEDVYLKLVKALVMLDASSLYSFAEARLGGLPTGKPIIVRNKKLSFSDMYNKYLHGRKQWHFLIKVKYIGVEKENEVVLSLPIIRSYLKGKEKSIYTNDIYNNEEEYYLTSNNLGGFCALNRIDKNWSIDESIKIMDEWSKKDEDRDYDMIYKLEKKLCEIMDRNGYIVSDGEFYKEGKSNRKICDIYVKLFDKRQLYIKNGNKKMGKLIKNCMNGTIGRKVVKYQKYENKIITDKRLKEIEEYNSDKIVMKERINGRLWNVKMINEKDSWTYASCLALVYSWSKMYMSYIAECFGGDKIYYSDTDSLVFERKYLEDGKKKIKEYGLDKWVYDNGLGKLHNDVSDDEDIYITEMIVLARKTYCCKLSNGGIKYSIKGINKEALEASMKEFKCNEYNIYKRLYNGYRIMFNLLGEGNHKYKVKLRRDMKYIGVEKFERELWFE